MKIYIVSDNQDFHCADDEQHIVKIFDSKQKAEKWVKEQQGCISYDVLEWEVK